MNKLIEVFADFARLEEWPELGLTVPLVREDRTPALAQLQDGQRVLLVEPDNLRAEGIARHVDSGGYRYWFGVLARMAGIQDIEPETPVSQEQATCAAQG